MLLERTNSRATDLLVELRRDSGVALHRQLETSLRAAIRAGRLPRGTSLPPTRGLAADLRVSRGVVVEAYQQLVAEGYLTSRPGGYTRVAAGSETSARRAAPPLASAPRIDFCPCRADGSEFPRAAWLRSLRRVLTEAYQQLVAEGYLTSRPGGYTRVAAGSETSARPVPPPLASAPRIDFCPCRADGSGFPRAAWLRSLRRVLTEASAEDFGYVRGRGAPALQHALAAYLNRVRGTSAAPDQLVICNGYAQGVGLIVQTLRQAGATRLAVEDPCADDDAVPIARAAGLEVLGVPVGEHGISVDALERIDADALILTPSHQWPTGAVLSAAARSAVLGWAERRGALIVEDDYDAEYRYDRAPLGAMQGLAPERVVYAGTASKTLAPGLRLGWLVAPTGLVDAIAEAKALADRGSPVLDQMAFADFLERGEFDRHLRRMRPRYRRRRDALVGALRERLPDLEPAGIAAGLHLVAYLPGDLDEATLVEAAARRGVALYGLAPYRVAHAGRPGLIFGYATLDERAIDEGVQVLADVVAEARRSS